MPIGRTDHVLADAGLRKLGSGELPVLGRGGIGGERAFVADVHQPQRLDGLRDQGSGTR
jgi:hypothetical protein